MKSLARFLDWSSTLDCHPDLAPNVRFWCMRIQEASEIVVDALRDNEARLGREQ